MLQMPLTSLALLVGLLSVAVYTDLRYHRIPNALTFGGFLAGLLLVVHGDASWHAFGLSLAGGICGILLFLPVYALGKMGAGDVKLLGMVGVFLGPVGVFWAMVYSLIAGGALALIWLIGAYGFREMAFRTLGTVTLMRLPGAAVSTSEASSASPMKAKMPYAPALAIGAAFAARLHLT